MTPEDRFAQAVDALRKGEMDGLVLVSTAETILFSGRADLAAQLYRYGIAAAAHPQFLPVLQYNLAIALDACGDPAGSREALEQALRIAPALHPARLRLGVSLMQSGETEAALTQWREALAQLQGVNRETIRYKKAALNFLASHLEGARNYGEAEQMLAESLALAPDDAEVVQHWLSTRQEQCVWPLIVPPSPNVERSHLLRQMMPLSLAAYADDPLMLLASAAHYTRTTKMPDIDVPVPARPKDPAALGRRLRIGYLSSDLCQHAVGSLVPEVFERHDRSRFEIVAYYTGAPTSDSHSGRLKAAVERWVELTGMDDVAAARAIASDGIDILVDLNGHTRGARPAVIGLRPAPVIVNWLGYPGTMGSPYHHYILADDWIVPPSHELYYSEKVLRLPCYQPNDTRRALLPPPTRESQGLPDNAVVFCCFNSGHKITRWMFDTWMDILRQVPDSVLWLLQSSDNLTTRLRAAAAERGIAPERLVFAGRAPNPLHLARYQLADLFLDTAPYGAHTTSSDALWAGVPVLTVSGRCFASRVCGSLVRSAGLPQLVCDSTAAYLEQAVALGRDRAALKQLKDQLAANRATCTLFDMAGHVRALETLYQGMWRDYCDDALPVSDLTNLDAYLDAAAQADFDKFDSLNHSGYHQFLRERLSRIHLHRPLAPDQRLWRNLDGVQLP